MYKFLTSILSFTPTNCGSPPPPRSFGAPSPPPALLGTPSPPAPPALRPEIHCHLSISCPEYEIGGCLICEDNSVRGISKRCLEECDMQSEAMIYGRYDGEYIEDCLCLPFVKPANSDYGFVNIYKVPYRKDLS